MHRRTLMLITALTLGLPSPAFAQDDFSRLKVRLGQVVYVTDASTGVEVNGPLTSLSSRDLSIDGYRFEPKPGLKIEKAGDSIWDGAGIGFGLGALILYPVVPPFSRNVVPVRIANGVVWGLVGALIDREHIGRTTIYEGAGPSQKADALGRSVRLVPEIDAHRKAIAMAIRF